MDAKLNEVEVHNNLFDKIDKNSTFYSGLIDFNMDVYSNGDILCNVEIEKELDCDECHNENFKQNDYNDNSENLVELIEIEDQWLDENNKTNFDNEDFVLDSSEDLVELIEVEDEWEEENFQGNDCNENDAMGSLESLVELIEVDDDWLRECHNKSENCANSVMDGISLCHVEEIEFNRHQIDYESINNESNSTNEVELIEVPDPAESDEIEDEYEYVERICRIAELKKSLTELKDSSTFTKRGLVRKRRAFKLSLKERAIKKLQLKQSLHPVRKPCTHDSCRIKISKNRRKEINKEFWEMGFSERYTLGFYTIYRKNIKQRRKNTRPLKNNTFQYYFKDDDSKMQQVCKSFYLTTLGFSRTNDSFIKTLMGKNKYKLPLPRLTNHANYLKPRKEDYETIISHINSFDPNISHHRREHAPKKKYLPNNLTIRSMYDKFKREYPDIKCSYYLYRRIVSNELNISFTKLGHEQCETCEEYVLHDKSVSICDSCELCEEYEFHKTKFTESRELYSNQLKLNTEKKSYCSGDMEKVVMLPRLEMFKSNIFSTRLSAYNDTFAPQFNPPTSKPVATIWHEGISGRCKEDIISAFYKFFIHRSEIEEHVMWLDNCSSQNKNWALLTFLVYIINSNLIKAQKIHFNYFEPGHTFMAADSFHHQVELSMKKMEKVYNFDDFQKAVAEANSKNVTVITMEAIDFKYWIDGSSHAKKKAGQYYLHEMVQITATRGSYDLTFKKSFSSSDEYKLDYLLDKYKVNGIEPPAAHTSDCGISAKRKANILATGKIIPEGKIEFWKNISVSDESSLKAIKDSVPRRTISRQNKVTESRNQHQKERKCLKTESAQSKKTLVKKCQSKKSLPKKPPPKKTETKKGQPKKSELKKAESKKIQRERIPEKSQPKVKLLKPKQCQQLENETRRRSARMLQKTSRASVLHQSKF